MRAAACGLAATLVALAQPQPAQAQAPDAADQEARALERVLTREGGLLLPKGTYEIEPRVEYSYRAENGLDFVDGTQQVARQDVKQDVIQASVGLRAGVASRTQVELRLPYVLIWDDRSVADQAASTRHADGLGDIELGLARQLTGDASRRPAILAALNWRIPTGQFHLAEQSPGGGFHVVQASITAVKRDDPVVLFGNLSYATVLARRHDGSDIDPGDSLGLRLGTIFAASPSISLRGALQVNRVGRTEVNGVATGSQATPASLQFGTGILLSARTLFDLQVNAGLTPDAPRFAITVSIPVRFD